MKKTLALLLTITALLSCSACTGPGSREDFVSLYEAFVTRGEGVEGYEVTEIEEYDGMEYFSVLVCLNTDDAVVVDDYMWFEANVMYFHTDEEADAAYEKNQKTGMGGTCLREGNVLIYWMTADPFADLYQEVFTSVFG